MESALLLNLLQSKETWKSAASVLLFSPLPDEPQIQSLLPTALAEGKKVYLPYYESTSGVYWPKRVEKIGKLQMGRYGIPEPDASCAHFSGKQLDFILVPGVAFDLAGHRLGRGKGFYDRLLAELSGLKCGTCFDWQLFEKIPVEPHDVRLNCLLTPTLWHEIPMDR